MSSFYHDTRHFISSITYSYLLLFYYHTITSLLLLPSITITTASSITNAQNNDDKLTILAEEISQTVLTLASQMEEAHSRRCDYNLTETCHGSHYSLCRSRFPHPTCIGGDGNIVVTNDTTASANDGNETETVISSGDSDGDDDGYNDTTTTTTTTTAASSTTPTVTAASSAAVISSACTTTNNNTSSSCGGIIDPTTSGLHLSSTTTSLPTLMESLCATPTTTTTSLSLFTQSYYATTTGLFSLSPARPYCSSTYNPHHRPWYVAASTGPKDVLFVLDASGSMMSYNRWSDTVSAVVKVVTETLTRSDYVSVIVASGDGGEVLTGEYMVQMTTEGREMVIELLMGVTPGGGGDGTNDFVTEGILMALDVWETSVVMERGSGCGATAVALLTVTDGVIGENEMYWDEVRVRLNDTSSSSSSPVLFVYGLGYESGATQSQSQSALCSVRNGVWNYIPEGGDVSRVMMDYYTVFLTVGSDDDDDSFTAWVDPYEFASSGVMGTTIAAPVYDRTTTPSKLIGVVGIDVTMNVLDVLKATGSGDEQQMTLDQLVMRSRRPTCPPLNNITACYMQRWRSEMTTTSDVCPGQCTDYNETHDSVVHDPWLCPNRNESEYDINPWNNTDYDDDETPFVERACCQSLTIVNNSLFPHDGSNLSSTTTHSYQQCLAIMSDDETTAPPSSSASDMASTYGVIIFIVILVILIGIVCGLRRRRLQKQQEQIEHQNQQIASPTSTTQAVITGYAVTEEQQQKLPYSSSQQPYQPQQYPPPTLNIPEERLAIDGNVNGTPGSTTTSPTILPFVYPSAMATQANNESEMTIGYSPSYDDALNLPPAIADHMIAAPPTPQHSYRDLR